MQAHEIMKRARAQLVIHRPFFGQIALMLEMHEEKGLSPPTMATDGKKLLYQPDFVEQLGQWRLETALCHEILHVAMAHPARHFNRNPKLWKLATDYAINPILSDCGYDVSWLLYEEEWHGLDADTIYAKLLDKAQQSGGSGDDGDCPCGHGHGSGDSGFESKDGREACGGLREAQASNEAEQKKNEQEMRSMVARASTIAKMQGNMPGSLSRLVDDMMKPKVDWYEKLRHFMERAARNDYSWSRGNRRHIGRGFYLPTLHNMEMGELVVAVDTSGSISEEELTQFLSEVSAICEQLTPECVYVVYVDTQVAGVDAYEPSDLPLKANPRGGGGTDFRPPFEWVEENQMTPQCLLYLTDMACDRYPDEPDYPVMWVSSVGSGSAFGQPPFGEVIDLA
jgi:predicted metal-dependent peptidase